MCIACMYVTGKVYKLQKTLFPKMSFTDPLLLEDVIRCYKERETVCRNCYYSGNKLSRYFDARGCCTLCDYETNKLVIIPKSRMTINYYECEIIAIPPWPMRKLIDQRFQPCVEDNLKDHMTSLIISHNSTVWYAHTIEELVIWTIERDNGKDN